MNHARPKRLLRLNPSFHRDYFHKIDEPQKAYWLGYLYNVGRVRKDGYFYLARTLNQDLEALARFSMDLNLNSDILNRRTIRKNGKVDYITYYLGFMDKEFTDGFYGYIPGGDSYINKEPLYPNISPEYNRHFIRGLFDSYSSVIKKNYGEEKRMNIRIDGRGPMLETVAKILKDEIEMNSSLKDAGRALNRLEDTLSLKSTKSLPDFILYLYDGVERYNTTKYEQLMDLFHLFYS